MGRIIFGVMVVLAAACGGLVLLIWWLWRLWTREQQAAAPFAESREETPAVGVERPDVALRAARGELEVELSEKEEAPPMVAVEPPSLVVETPVAKEPSEVVVADDLKKIEGIGPKISSVLQAAGISTFARLADSGVQELLEILEDADPRLLRLADPSTWSEQARLAAAGDWDGLGALQGRLRGGRRT